MTMARSSLMRWVQRAAAQARASGLEPPSEQQRERAHRQCESRRAFIRGAAALGAGIAAPALLRTAPAAAATAGRVVVVGAGLAGLAAAHELSKAGIRAVIVEASPRAGGRCWTERRAFDHGQIAERGGELIDTAHDAIIDLAIELGLPLDDLHAAETPGAGSSYAFDGTIYAQSEATADFRKLLPRLAADVRALGGDLPTFRRYTKAQAQLDRLSAAQWIDSRVDGGMRSRFGRLLANAYTEELGGDPQDVSAVTVVALLAGSPRDRFSPYEESDQRYHVRGGNDLLVERLAQSVGAELRTSTRLAAIARLADGRVRLTLQRDQAVSDEVADRVVLALPFTMLRNADLARSGFRSRKLRAIRELGMGRNTKLQLQFGERAWLASRANGETRVDGAYHVSWEVTRGQPGPSGILNFFSGGSAAVRAGEGTPEERARDALADLERALPGVARHWNGRVIRNPWDRHPWTHGSYSLLMPGQYTAFHGIEDVAEGSVHFAGEQSSMDFAGYLNGAVESGQRAARDVLAAMGLRGGARRAA